MRARSCFSVLGCIAWPLLVAGCSGDLGEGDGQEVVPHASESPGGGGAPATSASSASSAASSGQGGEAEGGGGSSRPPPAGGPCPEDMVFIGTACMDRFEAPNVLGAEPLVMQSALTGDAWCAERGKRLCTEDEWDAACQGPEGLEYPYGDAHEAERCNDNETWIAPDEATLATWPSPEAQAEVEALYQAAPSGALEGCVSGYGVHDLTGNVEEWVVRTKDHVNEYPHVLKGCYWSGCFGGSKPKCSSTNPAHASAFKFYETGFRCCRDAD